MACLQINIFIFVILSLLCDCHSFIIAEKALVKVSAGNLNPSSINTYPTPSAPTAIMSSPKQCEKDDFQHASESSIASSQSYLMEHHSIISLADNIAVEVRAKRSSDKNDAKRRIPKGKQKKAKALGRLLMTSAAEKFPEDDYLDDDDDDYSMGLNGEKMNWEDYRNEDGSSVLELIALNARHKTRMQRAHGDENLY